MIPRLQCTVRVLEVALRRSHKYGKFGDINMINSEDFNIAKKNVRYDLNIRKMHFFHYHSNRIFRRMNS